MARTITVTRSMTGATIDQAKTPPAIVVTLDCGHTTPGNPLQLVGQDVPCPTCASIAAGAAGLPA